MSLHDPESARPWFAKALVIAEDLAGNDPASTRARVDVAFGRAHLAEALPDRQIDDAIVMMRDSVRIFGEIVSASPNNVGYRQWQARRYEGLARLLKKSRATQDAVAALERAFEIRQLVADDEPTRADIRLELSAAACGIADLLNEQRDPRLAAALDTAQRLLQPLEDGPATLSALTPCAECYEVFARASRNTSDGQQQKWLSKASTAWAAWRERGVSTPYTMARLRTVQLANR